MCSGADCNAPDAGSDLPSDGTCAMDDQCGGGSTPRCMHGTCVTSELADRWLCTPPEANGDGSTVRYSFPTVEFISRMPPKNLVVRACRTNDVGCSEPVGTFVDSAGTGMVELDLPMNFLGFFDVRSDDTLPALSYLTKPVSVDTVDRVLQVPSQSTVDLLAAVDGVPFEPAKGLALVEAFDCGGKPAGGVHFDESKGTSSPFYIIDHTPNRDATISVYDQVNDVADGGFINVQPGFVTFTARWGSDGPQLGEFNVHVRAGTVTFVDMYF